MENWRKAQKNHIQTRKIMKTWKNQKSPIPPNPKPRLCPHPHARPPPRGRKEVWCRCPPGAAPCVASLCVAPCVLPLCALPPKTGVQKNDGKVLMIKTTHSFWKNSKFQKAVCKPKICSRAESGFSNAQCPPRSGGGGPKYKAARSARKIFLGFLALYFETKVSLNIR